ncbi:EAL domain-containing protein [[Clostridium] spiroforme]|nr:EAL domain-containing protein [Thomasclavelia spiroformis]
MKHQYHDLIKSLNIFSQSTGDFYYFYDYHQKVIHFSDNIATANNALSALQTSINLHDWQNILDKRDINHANSIINKIKNKQTDRYNYNFRIIDKTKHTTWLNNKGKVYYDNEGEIEYILGRLSNYIPSSQTTSYNQKKLKTALNKLCSQAIDGYLMIIGIDDLKTINLKSGRAFGDGVISQVVYTIKKMTDSQFPLYRINGDCFALIMTNYQKNDVFRLYEKIKNELTHQCTISAGAVSLTDYHITNCNLLIQYSEIALDRAKSNGKNQLCFFNAQNYEQKLAELELIENIQNSINHLYEGFEVYYQPQIHSQTFQLYGAEALLRYISPKGEQIPVPYLISILEQNDLMYQIGLWVLKKALAACKKWRETFPDFHISVNMSYSQLQHDAIEFDIIDIVKNSGVPGKAITIEITESMELANYPHLNSLFKTWKNYGIEISIDDFGTGYSSLSRLKDMAVDEVKIDRCFVTEIQNSIYNYQLLNNIINLAKTSQIRVCCEGVENTPELIVIEKLKPSLYQGFFFGKPCNQTDFEQSFVLSQPVVDVSIFDKNEIEQFTQSIHNNEIAHTILNAENDIFYLSDLDNYELYYLNPAGQKIFGVKDYHGKKCYEVLHGYDKPCHFCTNKYLRQDSFYIWENNNEYCGRHFLLKDKLVPYQGKKVRLEVALDITEQEYVSQSGKERLTFANKIVDYVNILSQCSNYDEAVNKVLASVGDFYQADRAYLFERDQFKPDHWNNTFEWCQQSVEPQIKNLQCVPPQVLERWMKAFQQNKSIIIYNLSPLKKISPYEWEVLHKQDIQRLIAVPLCEKDKIIGFIGVDNPRYCIRDDSQVRVLANFLLTRIRQDYNESYYRLLLQENNTDLLHTLNIGFWTLQISRKDQDHQLTLDHFLKKALNAPEQLNDHENYVYWISRINNADNKNLKKAITTMQQTGKLAHVKYQLKVNDRKIKMHLSGILIDSNDEYYKFKGYCRMIED